MDKDRLTASRDSNYSRYFGLQCTCYNPVYLQVHKSYMHTNTVERACGQVKTLLPTNRYHKLAVYIINSSPLPVKMFPFTPCMTYN